MSWRFNRLDSLSEAIEGKVLRSIKAEYRCIHLDSNFTVFDRTKGTKKVMIPTEVLLEWISCYEDGLITEGMTARECREVVRRKSEWASQLHSFETHLFAVLEAWKNR